MRPTLYTATPPNTTFLYPESRQYPVDEVCEKIVRALEKRNWKAPGIQVEFADSGTGELKYRYVSRIEGEDFRLWFCRTQGMIGWKFNIAAVSEMVIPRKELHVYEDESGPTFYSYVGDNWEEDKETFMNKLKVNSKLRGMPKTYLQYSGRVDESDNFHRSYLHRRNPYLVNDSDMGREYKACDGEPKHFRTDQVFQEFNEWLNANVLKRIESLEEAKVVELTAEPSIPYPEHIGPLYIKISRPTYVRIIKGKEDKNQLEPSDRYALTGGGDRLVDLSTKNDGSVPKEAYDGFRYCSWTKPGLEEGDRVYCAVVRINPKNANDIFVADYEAGVRFKRLCVEADPEKHRLTDEEYHEYQRCMGRTLVPIHEYKGDYENPMVLIGSSRELSFDEVEIVDVKE